MLQGYEGPLPSIGTGSLSTRERIMQANTFAKFDVLFLDGGVFQLASATDSTLWDTWLILDRADDWFEIPTLLGKHYCPAHGLGGDGELLYMSIANKGKPTLTSPLPGQPETIIARIVDKDNILYNPPFFRVIKKVVT